MHPELSDASDDENQILRELGSLPLQSKWFDPRLILSQLLTVSQAWSFEVLSTQEKLGIRHMIKDVIRHLQKASVRPNDFHSRYSELLDRLWQRKDTEIQARATAEPTASNPPNNQPTGLGDGNGEYAATSMRNGGWYDGQQDEFSWLDLQAVGELVSGEPGFGTVDGYSSQFMNMNGDWGGDFWGF